MTIAIICARGGSKRLPRKNVKEFCGIPLVAWAIIQAKCSVNIDKVFVSTDDDEIEKIAEEFGAQVIRRPEWPDADQAAANRPFIHAIKTIKNIYGDEFDTVITMLPTTPLQLPGEMDNGIEMFRQTGSDYIGPLRPMREMVVLKKTHPFRCRCVLFDKNYGYLAESNAWVVTTPEWYTAFNSEISDLDVDLNKMENWPSTERYFLPAEYWQYADVDTAEEFEFAEILMNHYILKGKGVEVYFDYYNSKTNDIMPLVSNLSNKESH